MTIEAEEQRVAALLAAGSYTDATRILLMLAERNSVYALLSLGWIYETGATGIRNEEVAKSYYGLAADDGDAYACFCLGRLLVSTGHEIEAREVFGRGAALGNNDCKSELIRLQDEADAQAAEYAMHSGDHAEATRLLIPLAERGDPHALLSLGWIREAGADELADWESAAAYYERAAYNGLLPAYFELGRLLLRRDEKTRARAAFKKGAEGGHVACMAWIGRMMVKGEGGGTDLDAGLRWLQTAAEQGQVFAKRTLLAIEAHHADTFVKKLSIKIRIATLAMRTVVMMWRDPRSDKVR